MRLANAKNRLPQSLNSFPRLRNNVQKSSLFTKRICFLGVKSLSLVWDHYLTLHFKWLSSDSVVPKNETNIFVWDKKDGQTDEKTELKQY